MLKVLHSLSSAKEQQKKFDSEVTDEVVIFAH
jgi:hypothetical protein